MTPANQLRLDDGFSTIITLENIPTIKLFEKELTPPGYSAGGPIETTTMRNIAFRTSAPRKLKNLTAVTFTAAYATEVVPLIWEQIGVNQLVTVTYPDESHIAFWGWLEEFTPNSHKEGEQPTAKVTIHPGMRNSDGDEIAPVYASAESGAS